MRFDTVEVRLSLGKLLTGLVLIIVPLSCVGLYLTSQSYASLQEAVGGQLRALAQADGAATAQFINDRIAEVSILAAEPVIANAVTAANRASERVPATVLSASIEETEKDWNSPKSDQVVGALLSSPASKFLSRYKSLSLRL